MIGYVEREEVSNYLAQYYLPGSPEAIRWSALSDNEKDVYLRKALVQIEALPYTGFKTERNQVLEFPRNGDSTIDSRVKYAQIEYALALTDTLFQKEMQQRLMLQKQGIKSFKLGDLSESYVNGAGRGVFPISATPHSVLVYLNTWLMGGFDIC